MPKTVYIRNTSDVVKQLSSIGFKTYLTAHKQPKNNALAIRALSKDECTVLWESVRKNNMDMDCPAMKGGPDIYVCLEEDTAKDVKLAKKKVGEDAKVRA